MPKDNKPKKLSTADFQRLLQAFEEQSSGTKSYKDDRFWYPAADKAGNSASIIRFLPVTNDDELPWTKYWNHSFKNEKTGKWYIELCLTTLGQDDPVVEHTTELWNSGSEANKQLARDRKRKLTYVSKIQVIADGSNPDNNGKVFLFKYGKKIFDKIKDMAVPEFETETPVNVFDLKQGANFKFLVRKVDGRTNYDKSSFDSPSALPNAAEVMKEAEKLGPLSQFVDPKLFKSYEELKKKLNFVLYGKNQSTSTASAANNLQDELPTADAIPFGKSKSPRQDSADDLDTDATSYFQSLTKDDDESDDIPY